MADDRHIEEKFWKALKHDRTVMLGLADIDDGAAQPMTAQLDEEANGENTGPIYFFTAKDTDLVRDLGAGHAGRIHLVSKGHDVFACVSGELRPDNDTATIDRLWNPFVAAWFEGGKTDPKLQLLRFEPRDAQIWLNENSLFAGVRILLGRDPKADYADKMADVRLS
jgi:general stress protein 26